MKRFLIWISTVIITLFILDIVAGKLYSAYIKNHILPGEYGALEKILRHNDTDLLVLGSSVALISIDNKVLGDSLGLTTYNGGGNGQTFPFFTTMLKGALANRPPKQILLCVLPSDFTSHGLGQRYNIFAPYYGLRIADIDENLNKMDRHNTIFLQSTFYRLNKHWFRLFLYHFTMPNILGQDGHFARPLPPAYPTKYSVSIGEISAERKKQLIEFLAICRRNHIKVTILFTPALIHYADLNDPTNAVHQVQEIAARFNASVYVDSNLEPFTTDPSLFYDNIHLNIEGTKIYTDTVLTRLKHNH